MAKPRTAKGEQTRSRLLETALKLFEEGGNPTMREIAREAGLSLGNAYYYFPSKEHLVLAFYERTHQDHLDACSELLESEHRLKARILGALQAKLETLEPYHAFAGRLFGTAGDPASPLSPFGEASAPVRRQAVALWARVAEESRTGVPEDLGAELPQLLWLYQMGVIFFWLHDDSPKRKRTQLLVLRTVDMLVRLIGMASSPLLKPIRVSSLRLLRELRSH